jgi:hypothetical protein
MSLELPALPFAKQALEPPMSADTLAVHHGKHHNACVVKGNELLAEAGLEGDSLSPNGGGQPGGAIAARTSWRAFWTILLTGTSLTRTWPSPEPAQPLETKKSGLGSGFLYLGSSSHNQPQKRPGIIPAF